MGKFLSIAAVLASAVVVVAIASLVINIVVFVKFIHHAHKHKGDEHSNTSSLHLPQLIELDSQEGPQQPLIQTHHQQTQKRPCLLHLDASHVNSTRYCPSYAEAHHSPEWKGDVLDIGDTLDLHALSNCTSTKHNSSILLSEKYTESRVMTAMLLAGVRTYDSGVKSLLRHSSVAVEAASQLLEAMDQSIDPCEDFYSFSCNNFVKKAPIGSWTYLNAQIKVNQAIEKALEPVEVYDVESWSMTEKITKAIVEACVTSRMGGSTGHAHQILNDLAVWFGGVPFLGVPAKDDLDIFSVMGTIEQERALGTFMGSWVTVDYKDSNVNALYVSQPSLPMPREYYIYPQFSKILDQRAEAIENLLNAFAERVLKNPEPLRKGIRKVATDVATLEREIAQASWPDDEMRNYALQYNKHNLKSLQLLYPSISFKSYLESLLSSVDNASSIAANHIIIAQPSYFAWLNSLFAENKVTMDTLVNYMITQLIFDEAEFLGSKMREASIKANYVSYAQRRRRGLSRIGQQLSRRFDDQADPTVGCVEMAIVYMPYGPGYVYTKSLQNREQLRDDTKEETEYVIKAFMNMVQSLDWMTDTSLLQAKKKADEIIRNIGWPTEMFGNFKNWSAVDNYHKDDYFDILHVYQADPTDFYTIRNILKRGLENREAFRLLTEPADRYNFFQSPAMVNAWYQPERNSLTIPSAFWNPPYYSQNYPKAYNFAGIGGTVGHELVHGFDDEGVQFGADGMLANCKWHKCSWLDKKAQKGFANMTRCVVNQYNTQCCPEKNGYVHCVNGATTQGENIADLGGQLAGYLAYHDYLKRKGLTEKRLPGLEQFTPNEIFWIAYGYSWCSRRDDDMLVAQLMTDPHAPSMCRTNQVVQDMHAFSKDFGCKAGQRMYPPAKERCDVWASEQLIADA